MIAAIDETTPEVAGGICYVLVTSILLSDEAAAKAAASSVVGPHRTRPFHWATEGVTAKERMLVALSMIDVLARATVVRCGRSGQEAARGVALAHSVRQLVDDGCERLLIESRSQRQDARDRQVILDVLSEVRSPKLAYEWRGKDEPLLWIPDAIAGGVREHLVGARPEWFDRIRRRTGLELSYQPLERQARKMRQSRLPS